MKLGIDSKFFIKQVNTITDSTLNVIELDETADDFPFVDKEFWTEENLLTYCYEEIKNNDIIIEVKIYKQPQEIK